MRTAVDRFRFRGAHAVPATASMDGSPWTKAITGAAPPTVGAASGGAMELALTDDTQIQNACLYMGDVLPYDIDDLIRVSFIAKVSQTLDAATQLAFGLAGARNDAIDSIAQAILFRAIANNTIVLETDDGTTDTDDASSDGSTITTSYKEFVIDLSSGVKTQSPPSWSQGGKSDIRFLISNANGHLRQVGRGTAFSMNAYSGNLQLFAQIQKTSADDEGTLSILQIEVEYKVPPY